jgi:hypothetical protein
MFSEYVGLTSLGKKKVDCWSDRNDKRPNEVSRGSGKKFWFDCDVCPHEFYSVLYSIKIGSWCPYCSGHTICKKKACNLCFNKSFASYDELTPNNTKKVDCWSDRNEKKPHDLSISNSKKIYFDCDNCPHEFCSTLNHISKGKWCPYCSHNPKRCEAEDCDFCFNKSFASYDGVTSSGKKKVNCWSDRNEKKPREISLRNHKKCYFDCDKCSHTFNTALHCITREIWCPYCAKKKRCMKEDCVLCFNNSFASYTGLTPLGKKKVDCWSNKNEKKPHDIAIGCGTKFYFDCDKCSHEFIKCINDINGNQGWCPYCSSPCKKLCSEENCDFCFNNSFASYNELSSLKKKKVDCWSDKNEKNPRDVAKCSSKKFHFDCDACSHDFYSTVANITWGNWCPHCKSSKGEKKITEYIQSLGYPDMYQKTFEQCRDKNCLRFDNMIDDCNILIEFDGRQHFESIEFFGGKTGYVKRRMHDVMKNKFCLENNYLLLRIAHTEIDYIEQLIDRAIYMHREGNTGIIFSNPSLYKRAYL